MSSANGHNFSGLRVVAFENRHSEEMKSLIEHHKGIPTIVPAIREVPVGISDELIHFEQALLAGEVEVIVFLTGAGAHLLATRIEERVPRNIWVAAAKKTSIIARGPKAITVLKELDLPIWLRVPAPYTWREIISALDNQKDSFSLKQCVVAVQEYGMMNRNLMRGLTSRGAIVMRIPIYKWALPENLNPLRLAVENLADGRFDVSLFTSSAQVWHLFKVASKKGMEDELREGLSRIVVASIGPSTNEALAEFDVKVDLVPPQTKMEHLVKFAAWHAQTILASKHSFAK